MRSLTDEGSSDVGNVSEGRPKRRRLEHAAAVGILLALTLIFFNPLFRGNSFSTVPAHKVATYPWRAFTPHYADPVQSDQADLSYPWHVVLTRALRSGTLPLWDRHSYIGGAPLYSNGSSGQLYPPRLLTAATLGPARSHDVMSALTVFLAGLFAYVFLAQLGVVFPAAILGAVSWMFASFNTAWLHLEVVAPVAVFLPLSLVVVHRAHRRATWSAAVVAGLVLGLALVSGHLLLLENTYLVALGYGGLLFGIRVVRTFRGGDRRAALGQAARFGAIVITSLGAAAVVLVPTSITLAHSQRTAFTYAELRRSFLTPASVVLRYTFRPPPIPRKSPDMNLLAFAGTAVAGLAVIGLFVRRPGGWLGRLLAAGTFAIIVGTPATWFVYHVVPGFDVLRPYARLLFIWCFAVSILGALGLDALWRLSSGRIGALLRSKGGRIGLAMASAIIIAVTAVQLEVDGRRFNPLFAPTAAAVYGPTPLIDAMEAEVHPSSDWPGRIVPVRVLDNEGRFPPTLFAAESLIFGVDSGSGYDSVTPVRTSELVRVFTGEDPNRVLERGLGSGLVPTFFSERTRFDLVPRLGITTIVASPRRNDTTVEQWGNRDRIRTEETYSDVDGRVFRVAGATSDPVLLYSDETVPGRREALLRFVDRSLDAGRTLVVERSELDRTGVAGLGVGTPGTGRILSKKRGINSATVEVSSTAPAWLLVRDSWDPGWTATVNGRRAPVVLADYAMRAVRVPAGHSLVEMRFRPEGFTRGLLLTLLTLAASLAVIVGAALPRRRSRAPGA